MVAASTADSSGLQWLCSQPSSCARGTAPTPVLAAAGGTAHKGHASSHRQQHACLQELRCTLADMCFLVVAGNEVQACSQLLSTDVALVATPSIATHLSHCLQSLISVCSESTYWLTTWGDGLRGRNCSGGTPARPACCCGDCCCDGDCCCCMYCCCAAGCSMSAIAVPAVAAAVFIAAPALQQWHEYAQTSRKAPEMKHDTCIGS
jgi:hypothetical protein